MSTSVYQFPKWLNRAKPIVGMGLLIGPLYAVGMFVYGGQPILYDQGYQPKQPVDYSHALHAGELKIDCRYCHTAVEKAAHANIPATQTCMTCHTNIKKTSAKLEPVRESAADGKPVQWNKVHRLPDFAYFNHSAHVGRNYGSGADAAKGGAGIGCVSCHGRVDQMEVVHQAKELSMGWCLECHRAPENHLRPLSQVTNMNYQHDLELGKKLRKEFAINPSQECSTCHR